MTSLILRNDSNFKQTFARPYSDTIFAVPLPPNSGQSIATPSNANFVVFSCDGNFYAKKNSSFLTPSGHNLTSGSPELNPVIWDLGKNTTGIGLASPISGGNMITLTFYS